MNIWRVSIDLTLLLQLLVTIIIITIYAVLTSLEENRSTLLSRRHMILLIYFLINNDPKVKNLLELAEAKQEHVDDSTNELCDLSRGIENFKASGSLPDLDSIGGSGLSSILLMIIFAPAASLSFCIFRIVEMRSYKFQRIIHTEWRKDDISKYILMFSGNLLILTVGVLFVIQRSYWWGALITGVAVLGALAAIVIIAITVWGQSLWKDYWQIKLLDVMAVAGKEDNHDLFNRAMILKGYIESQPDIPIPGNLGFYGLVFSAAQGIILFISRTL